ncbi:MAG: nucleotidyltransferase domain-containing protein [Promethearchaeota archaeon]
MSKKPVLKGDRVEIIYTDDVWKLLKEKRGRTIQIIECLNHYNIRSFVHGSVARGSVSQESDIDVVIPYVIPSFSVELALREGLGINVFQKREIVHATPYHTPKAHILIDELTTVTFPLTALRSREHEFYAFGGKLDLNELKTGKRVPGVDKRLILIEPSANGHYEWPIFGRESEAARIIGVSINIVEERVKILLRRDDIGRTGTYLKRMLQKDEIFEEVFKRIIDSDPVVRRRVQKDT